MDAIPERARGGLIPAGKHDPWRPIRSPAVGSDGDIVLFDPQDQIPYHDMIGRIEHDLVELLKNPPPLDAPVRGRLSRQVRNFPLQPQIEIRADERGNQYLMSITASDRPGLLYAVSYTLARHHIAVQTAKIATLGERAEDTFLIAGDELAKTSTLVKLEQELLAVLTI